MQSIQIVSKNLKQLSTLYLKLFTKQLSRMDLDNYVEILLIIYDSKQPYTQNQLAELFQIDKSKMVSILHNLSKKNFVNIVRNPDDRREHFVYLTPEAEKIIPSIKNVMDQTTSLAQSGIAQDKLDCCFDVLETIQKNLVKGLVKTPDVVDQHQIKT